jgi:hypothetical protein
VKATIKNVTGMKAQLWGDLGAGRHAIVRAHGQIKLDFFVARQKVGFVQFTRLTDATYLFELNVKGEKVGLSYTIPQEGVDDSEYRD